MDVQVTIKISREALEEAVGVLRQFLNPQVSFDGAAATPQMTVPQATVPPSPVAPAAQQATPPAAPVAPAVPATVPTTPAAPPAAPVVPAAPATVPAVPTAEHTYTAEELQVAAVTLVDKGMMTQLQSLLAQFGVSALPELPAEKYGEFATALRGLGAQI